ncbi:MAG: RNA polymerase sigma factor [Planctomycetota bacterium]|jgi:RNA polymerase sigma-70 factor (ECF subfamily)
MRPPPDAAPAFDEDAVTDDELFGMFRSGDADAFDALFDRWHVPVYNLARHILHDAAGAEEIMQDTFMAVVRAAPRYESRGLFRAWIMGIARNRCVNRLESERARRRALRESGMGVVDPPSRAPSPDGAADADERVAVVKVAVARLPERQREAIVMYAFEEMPYAEVARAMGVPLNTVKTLIHRARAALARALGARRGTRHGEERDAV